MKGAIMATSNSKTVETINTETGEVTTDDLNDLSSGLTRSGVEATMDSLSGSHANVVSSYEGADFETLVQVASVVGNAEKLSENLDKPLNIVHYVAQQTEVESRTKPGVMEPAVRIVLVDDDGSAYAAMSTGIAKSLENLVGIVGRPATWKAPIKLKVVEQQGRNGKYFTVKYL